MESRRRGLGSVSSKSVTARAAHWLRSPCQRVLPRLHRVEASAFGSSGAGRLGITWRAPREFRLGRLQCRMLVQAVAMRALLRTVAAFLRGPKPRGLGSIAKRKGSRWPLSIGVRRSIAGGDLTPTSAYIAGGSHDTADMDPRRRRGPRTAPFSVAVMGPSTRTLIAHMCPGRGRRLDVGCGGGDVPSSSRAWASRVGPWCRPRFTKSARAPRSRADGRTRTFEVRSQRREGRSLRLRVCAFLSLIFRPCRRCLCGLPYVRPAASSWSRNRLPRPLLRADGPSMRLFGSCTQAVQRERPIPNWPRIFRGCFAAPGPSACK